MTQGSRHTLPGRFAALTCAWPLALLAAGIPTGSPAAGPTRPSPRSPRAEIAVTACAEPIRLQVAVTPAIRRFSGWRTDLARAVGEASRALEGALGCALTLDHVVSWSGGLFGQDLAEQLAFLVSQIGRGSADIVLGLAALPDEAGFDTRNRVHEMGMASWIDAYAVSLVSPASLRSSGLLLAHELGHVFGGIDREKAGGLMNPRVQGDRIDDVNATLMRLHVRRRFHTGDPLPPALTRRAAVLYATAARTLTGAGAIQARSRAVLLSLRLADVHLTRERWQEAASSLERALELDEGIADAWVNLGAARLRLSELDRSESATRRALELRPSHPQALLNLGVVTARRLDLRGAAHFYAMAAQAEPTYAEAHLNLGHAHLALGEPDAAERAYRRALALGGPAGLIHSGLALVHMARNERELADAELRTAIELGFDLSGETPGMSIGRVAVPSRGWKGDGRHEPRPPEARRDFP